MPKYTFVCTNCSLNKTLYANVTTLSIKCDQCSADMQRQIPKNGSSAVSEIVDSYTGTKRDQDHDSLKKERRDNHYWEVEVPRLVQTYSLQTCLEEGWLVYNDKGDLVINKPPSKR